eukprot:TRINITY_DN23579_c0_g1_i1.p1 TRINITY_DN23579_c0_g1~~TRINITY_DN23579_c0_g1_i1.p1  ORF type:complete len:379 (-),score=87.11 TRINITY_DN23579_c0_g1_i1:300-1436(-)
MVQAAPLPAAPAMVSPESAAALDMLRLSLRDLHSELVQLQELRKIRRSNLDDLLQAVASAATCAKSDDDGIVNVGGRDAAPSTPPRAAAAAAPASPAAAGSAERQCCRKDAEDDEAQAILEAALLGTRRPAAEESQALLARASAVPSSSSPRDLTPPPDSRRRSPARAAEDESQSQAQQPLRSRLARAGFAVSSEQGFEAKAPLAKALAKRAQAAESSSDESDPDMPELIKCEAMDWDDDFFFGCGAASRRTGRVATPDFRGAAPKPLPRSDEGEEEEGLQDVVDFDLIEGSDASSASCCSSEGDEDDGSPVRRRRRRSGGSGSLGGLGGSGNLLLGGTADLGKCWRGGSLRDALKGATAAARSEGQEPLSVGGWGGS